VSAAPSALADVLRHPGVWRRAAPVAGLRAQATGWRDLDAALPGGGWPLGALSEILLEADGLGELGLVMPALAALTRRKRRVVFVVPPYQPYAPALAAHGLDLGYVTQIDAVHADGAWSIEQCLRSGACAAVLLWEDAATDYAQLRRWQRAAESGGALAFLLRPARAADQPSPAALRLQLRDLAGPHAIEVLRSRGRFHGGAAAPPRRGD